MSNLSWALVGVALTGVATTFPTIWSMVRLYRKRAQHGTLQCMCRKEDFEFSLEDDTCLIVALLIFWVLSIQYGAFVWTLGLFFILIVLVITITRRVLLSYDDDHEGVSRYCPRNRIVDGQVVTPTLEDVANLDARSEAAREAEGCYVKTRYRSLFTLAMIQLAVLSGGFTAIYCMVG